MKTLIFKNKKNLYRLAAAVILAGTITGLLPADVYAATSTVTVFTNPDEYDRGSQGINPNDPSSGDSYRNSNSANQAGGTWHDYSYGDKTDFYRNIPYYRNIYDVSQAGSLNGVFVLHNGKELEMMYSKDYLGDWLLSQSILGTGNDQVSLPSLDSKAGELLAICGEEYGNRAPARRDEIEAHPTTLRGYLVHGSDEAYFHIEDIQSVEGASLAGVDWHDEKALNKALSGVGFTCDVDGYGQFKRMLSPAFDSSITMNQINGTTFTDEEYCAYQPLFDKDKDTTFKLPIERTQNGYFIVNTSSLKPGLYELQMYSGSYVFEIR